MECKQRLAVLTAIQSGVKSAVDEARAEVEDGMQPGDRLGLYVGGERVADATMSAPESKVSVDVTEPIEFMRFCLEYGLVPSISIPASWTGRNGWMMVDGDSVFNARTGEEIPGVSATTTQRSPVLTVRKRKLGQETDFDWVSRVIQSAGSNAIIDAMSVTGLLEEGD